MNSKNLRRLAVLTTIIPTVAVGVGAAGAAPVEAVIDFDGDLMSGDIVTVLSAGAGIAGSDVGTVGVTGTRSDLPDTNQAMIFDAACGGVAADCTGDDSDLFQPQLGNVLIISEDGDSSDPDDADVGEQFTFDFSDFGVGEVTVLSIDVLDVEIDETPASIVIGGVVVPVPDIGDGNVQTVPVNGTGSILEVILNGSGAIDNIRVEFEPAPMTTSTTSTTTTTTTTTTTSTTVPETTTTVPETTTTVPETTTTVPGTTIPETTTSAPGTTTIPETTTTTTAPPSTTTSTDLISVMPPTTTTTPPALGPILPETGAADSASTAMAAAVLTLLGFGLFAAARRSPRPTD